MLNCNKINLSLILLLILFGATNTIFLNLQNVQKFPTATNSTFFHPFIQCLCVFTGQILCFIPFILCRNKNSQIQSYGLQKESAPLKLIILPSIADLIATLLSYVALNLVQSSTWQISRGGTIISTAIFSKIILKFNFNKFTLIGCLLVFIGISGVQVISIVFTAKDSYNNITSQIIGAALLLTSIFFTGLCLVSEKWIFNKYTIIPLKLVAFEGLFQFIIMIIITFSLQYISCPWQNYDHCIKIENQFYIQNISVFFNQMALSSTLVLLTLGLIFSIFISVPIAVTISKKINPISRALADICRTVLIWAFGILITLTVGINKEQYRIEPIGVVQNIVKTLFFCFVIIGTLVYHQTLLCCEPQKQRESKLLTDSDSFDSNIRLSRKSSGVQALL